MPEITKNKLFGRERYTWLAFAVLTVFVYFFGLTIPLLGPDEPRYAQVAREMFEHGDWITPTLGGFHWFEKPALLYWLEIVSYHVFGISEFSARFGSALFGLGTILSLWLLGRFVMTADRRSGGSFADWLAVIAASTIGMISFSRGASFDIILTFPITAALCSFFVFDLGDRTGDRSRRSWSALVLFYFFIGISLLAKGLVGAILPLGVVGLFYVFSLRRPSRTFLISLAWGGLISVLVASVWYLPMYLRHGYEFIDEFIIQQHFQRFTSNKYRHPQPLYFFFWVLPLMTIPWLPFFIAAIFERVRDIFRAARDTSPEDTADTSKSLRIFAVSWTLVPVLFFSLSGSKLPGYVLPALPGAVLLSAEFVWRFVRRGGTRTLAVQLTAALVFLVTIALLIWTVPNFARADSVKEMIAAAADQGYGTQKVIGFYTISYNAEYYAAGRLVRSDDGKQKEFVSVGEIAAEAARDNSRSVLVLTPPKFVTALESDLFTYDVLDNNGELAIIAVKLR